MTDEPFAGSWREVAVTAMLVFLVAAAGCTVAFSLWLKDLGAPQVAILGSGNRLSLLVTDGPARLVIATGDDPTNFENALAQVRPIFAPRIDALLVAGSGETLLVPLSAQSDPRVRTTAALAPLPVSAETAEIGAITAFSGPRRIRLGPSVTVTVETAFPFGADPETEFPGWRATVEHGQSHVVVVSDSDVAALFPPPKQASVLVVSGDDPVGAWALSPASALVANAEAISGPDLRSGFTARTRPPAWGFRVSRGEALRIRFVPGGVEIPSESAHELADSR